MLVVTPNSRVRETSEIIRSLDTLDRRSVLATFARIPQSRETREAAAKRLELSSGDLRGYSVRASVLPNTNIIKIDVEGPDSERAAELANAVARVTQKVGRSWYRIYKMQVLARAVPHRRPTYPEPRRNYLAGAVMGLFLGIGAAFVVDDLRGRSSGSS